MLFSAYAEVFLRVVTFLQGSRTFLCLRRGVSLCLCFMRNAIRFSLPTQRCFPPLNALLAKTELFSAYAEVFLYLKRKKSGVHAFLCLRRGVSVGIRFVCRSHGFSLPTQRCF